MISRIILITCIIISFAGSVVATDTPEWDVSLRFDTTNYNGFYPFSKAPGVLGKTYQVKIDKEDDLLELEQYCNGRGHYWQRCASGCTPEKCSDDPVAACQCFDTSTCYRPKAWYAERKKINENEYQILVRGISKADCGKGQGYVKGELIINPDSDWSILNVSKCNSNGDNRGREHYCNVDESNGVVRFAGGSMCGGCCACQDSGWLNINITVGRNLTDLVIKNEDIEFSNHNPSKGQTTIINAVIYNEGELDAFDVRVGFYSRDPDLGGKLIGETMPGLIEANSSAITSLEWNVSGSEDIYIYVDPDDEIPESDENNNIAFKRLDVAELDYFLYIMTGIGITLFIFGVIIIFAVYKALTYKKPSGENMECPRCGMVLPAGTKKCPVCGNNCRNT